jgi:4-hydroxy-tetrahydrodipicolinate reductase
MTGQTPPLNIGIAGALGRMGQALAAVLAERGDVRVAAVFDRPESVGQRLGDLTLTTPEAAAPLCDVIIDFTTAEASSRLAEALGAPGKPALVIGSTGWDEAADVKVRAAATRLPIVRSGNYSLGVNVLAGLVRQAAERLAPEDWDIEVFEAHHRRKVDAPSGTALLLGDAAARGRSADLAKVKVAARDGITGARAPGTIGFSVLRGGGIVGEHSVTFASEDEVLTLAHSARDRRLFARGAVQAALWVARRPPGLYDMMDVLGFRE